MTNRRVATDASDAGTKDADMPAELCPLAEALGDVAVSAFNKGLDHGMAAAVEWLIMAGEPKLALHYGAFASRVLATMKVRADVYREANGALAVGVVVPDGPHDPEVN